MIYYRIIPEGNFLKAEDYRFGFGIDASHYTKIDAARKKYNLFNPQNKLPLEEDYQEDYDTRTGYNIENKPFNTRYHPYHDLHLIEKETKKRYIVDSVHKQHYFGFYIMLLIRAEGTNSHGVAYWENISCKEPSTIEAIEDTRERFFIL